MNIKQALHRYLTDPADLAGHPAVPFEAPTTVAGLLCANRNDARRWLRSKVGSSGIFSGRRPQTQALPNSDSLHTAIVLRTVSQDSEYDLAGAHGSATELLSVEVLARLTDAAARSETIADLLSLAVSGYVRDYWGDVYVEECLLDSRSSVAYSPPDGGDHWTHSVSLPLVVRYRDVAAPVYPADPLFAVISYTPLVSDSESLRLSSDESLVPAGRTLATVAWSISRDGSSLLSLSGAPGAAVTTSDVGGTYAGPIVDAAEFDLTGTLDVTLTLTDSAGFTSTAARQIISAYAGA